MTDFRLAMNFTVLAVDFHYLEEGFDLFWVGLLIHVDHIKESQDSSSNAQYFVDQMRQLNLDCHEKDGNAILKVELDRI